MHKAYLFVLLSTFGSSAAMDRSGNSNHFPTKTTRVLPKNFNIPVPTNELTEGAAVTWHQRKYTVTKRIEQNNEIIIVMARGTHHLFETPFCIEHITRVFRGNNQDPESTTATYTLAPTSLKATALLAALVALYAITP